MVEGCIIAAIPSFHTSNFIVADSMKFAFIGSLPQVMLNYALEDNAIVNEYKSRPQYGPRPLTPEMQKDFGGSQ